MAGLAIATSLGRTKQISCMALLPLLNYIAATRIEA